MRSNHLSYLVDPLTGEKLQLTSFRESGGHIMAGVLESKKNWYPIINGVPRMMIAELKTNVLKSHIEFYQKWKHKLPSAAKTEWETVIKSITNLDKFLKHQKKTAESFAFEWRYIYKENDYETENFKHFLSPFIGLPDIKGRVTIDIGCGSGRFTKQAALAGAKVAFGTDLGESVGVAFELTKTIPNVCIVQADIYAMPFEKTADIAYSIGVLHHLPQPKQGFLALPKVIKPEGKMIIWVYNRRNNARALYFYEPVRTVARHIPPRILFALCYLPGGIVHLINYLTIAANRIGAPKLGKKIPFAYYANFPFNMKLNDAFDVLATPKSNYYFVEQIEDWFSSAKLKKIKSFEHPEAGITCIGTR